MGFLGVEPNTEHGVEALFGPAGPFHADGLVAVFGELFLLSSSATVDAGEAGPRPNVVVAPA